MVIRLPLDAFLLNQPLDRSPRGAKPTCDLPNGQLGLLQELDRLFSLCGDEEKQSSSSHYQEATYMNRAAHMFYRSPFVARYGLLLFPFLNQPLQYIVPAILCIATLIFFFTFLRNTTRS